MVSLNKEQAKLLANFSSDLAKGLILAGVSAVIVSNESLTYKEILIFVNTVIAAIFLVFAIRILQGVRK